MYQQAARYRYQLKAIEEFERKQTKLTQKFNDQDVVHISHSDNYGIANKAKRNLNKHFIGPSSYTLQIENVVSLPEEGKERETTVPNIRDNYTVTDKADGDRKMLYIAENGYIYRIWTRPRDMGWNYSPSRPYLKRSLGSPILCIMYRVLCIVFHKCFQLG